MTLDDILTAGTEPQAVGSGYGFTEGPAADGQGNVYFSDHRNNTIYFYESGHAPAPFVIDSTDCNGMIVSAHGELYVCEGAAHRVVAFDLKTKAKRILCGEIDGQHFNEPNDIAADSTGGCYFSDPNYQHHGQPTVMKQDVYYCSPEGEVARVSTICFKPNGVLLSEDEHTLYVADARGQRIFRYRVAAPGQLAVEQLWIDRLGANPDGLTLDEHQNLYICCGTRGLKVYDQRGQPLGVVSMHAANACFGGSDFGTLFIASGDRFLALQTKVRGIRPLPARNVQ
ncbi:MAG: SMP-30/gluconolactonase/LRE family protein [Planctomycetota bacterium]